MKGIYRMMALGTLLLGLGLAGCGGGKEEAPAGDASKKEVKQEQQASVYYCPMKCEGEKTYAEAGSCPECGMDLVVKE